jgi:hypothetical protein
VLSRWSERITTQDIADSVRPVVLEGTTPLRKAGEVVTSTVDVR